LFVNNYIHVLNEKVVVIGKSCDMPAGLWERLCAYKPEDGKIHVFCMPSEDVAIDMVKEIAGVLTVKRENQIVPLEAVAVSKTAATTLSNL
jgi:hypothetical protein